MGVEASQTCVSGTPSKRGTATGGGNPCAGPRGCARSLCHASLPSTGDPCLPCEAGRECNQIMTRYSKLLSPVGKAGEPGQGKGVLFQDIVCLFILQLPLSPSPFPPFLLSPVLASPSLPPRLCSLPAAPGSWGRFQVTSQPPLVTTISRTSRNILPLRTT